MENTNKLELKINVTKKHLGTYTNTTEFSLDKDSEKLRNHSSDVCIGFLKQIECCCVHSFECHEDNVLDVSVIFTSGDKVSSSTFLTDDISTLQKDLDGSIGWALVDILNG